jgi:hypothetical protein
MDMAALLQMVEQRRRLQSALQAQAVQSRAQFMPMWAEDQMRGLRPGFQDNYDYWNALKYGVQRGPDGHMGSRVPQTGLLLKNPNHPTFSKTIKGEEEAGYEVYKGKDGRSYSRPKGGK